MAIDARRDLPLVVYGIANEEAYRQWRSEEKLLVTKLRGPNVLVRCGPVLDQNGNYTQQISSDVMIDGLDATAAGSGFSASVSGQKLVDYNLALRGLRWPTWNKAAQPWHASIPSTPGPVAPTFAALPTT